MKTVLRIGTETREAEVPKLERQATFKPSSVDLEKRTMDVVWTTGAKGLRAPFFGEPYYEELSLDPAHVRMDFLKSGRAPVLNVHAAEELNDVLGVVDSAELAKPESAAHLRMSKRDDVTPILQDVADGIVNGVSVGYRVYTYERQPDVEGQDYPTYLAVDWEPMEISLVPVGFDKGAGVRSNDSESNPCTIVNKNAQKRGEEEITMKPNLEQDPVNPAPAAPIDIDSEKRKAEQAGALAERKRQADIVSACRAAQMPEEVQERLISEGHPVDKAREMIFEELAKRSEQTRTSNVVRIEATGADASDKWREGASHWLMQRAGVAHLIEKHSGLKVNPGEFRGMSMVELARESLIRAGVKVRGMDKMSLVAAALTHRSGGMQTTSDFAVLLENTMNKTLLAAYATTPDTWSRFCRRGTVTDFRAQPRYRQGSFGRLDKVGEHGELKRKVIGDGKKETITADTFGNTIALTRQAIINDDMGAFSDLATRLGRAGKLSIEVDVYALLALNSGLGPSMSDGSTLFHASHNNISTGAALAVDALDADRVVMASQKDPNGNEILDLRPAVLVLPVGLGGQARIINSSQFDVSVSSKFQVPNKVAGLFRDIVDSPRLSGTRRYLFADPTIAPTLEVAFLDGQEDPYLENKDGFDIDGVEWKVRLDYGVGAIDYRGAVTNAGA